MFGWPSFSAQRDEQSDDRSQCGGFTTKKTKREAYPEQSPRPRREVGDNVDKQHEERYITVAFGCSGLDTPILALRKMGIKHRHLFSCDTEDYVREFLEANCSEWGAHLQRSN